MSEKGGGQFLNIKYPDLQKSSQVQESVDKKLRLEHTKTPNHPIDRNEVFLDRLEHIFDNPNQSTKERNIELFKNQFLYPEVLINKDNVPDSYFELQLKIARERGEGGDLQYAGIWNVRNIDDNTRRQAGEILHNDQKKSLDTWIDYLSSPDALYPTWFKYYTLRNLVKMGSYDKEKKEFGKRSNTSTGIFPDLNREALSFTYDVLQKRYLKHEQHTDEELKRIVDTANFSKIYAYAIDKMTPASKENKEKIDGEWVKFNQGSDATALYESLQGHGTGWCTAGEGMARSQLEAGDFYVYYTKDENNKNTIPRIAIRMENDVVAEVRGINYSQNLEENMMEIAQEKYHPLPGGEQFDKKDADMKRLTFLDNKVQKNEELSEDEIIFIYELKGKIEGFGYEEDPRIEEIRSKLDVLESFNKLTKEEDQEGIVEYLVSGLVWDQLSGENLDRVWEIINEKGGEKAATSFANKIQYNNELSQQNLYKAFDFIIREGGEDAAGYLAYAIQNYSNELSGVNLDKFVEFIISKGEEEAAAGLAGVINEYNLSGENLDKSLEFILSKGGRGAAIELSNLIIENKVSGENLDKSLEFIFSKGGEKAAAGLADATKNYNQLSGENLDKSLEFIFREGGEEAATGLAFTIENRSSELFEKNLDKVLDFIISKGGYWPILHLSNAIKYNKLSGENLDKALDFIISKGGSEAARNLADGIKNNKLSGENLNKTFGFIIDKGEKEEVVKLSYLIRSGDLSKENLDKGLDFFIKEGGEKAAKDSADAISNGQLSGENLDKALDFIISKGGSEAATDLARVIIRDNQLSGENLTKAWKFIDDKGGENVIKDLNDAIEYNKLSGENLDKAWEFVNGKGDGSIATGLAYGIMDNKLSGENLDKAWEFVNEKGEEDTATRLIDGIILDKSSKENLDKAWEFINKKGGDGVITDLVQIIREDKLPLENLDKAWEFINNKGGENIIKDLNDAIKYNDLSGENLEKAKAFLKSKGLSA